MASLPSSGSACSCCRSPWARQRTPEPQRVWAPVELCACKSALVQGCILPPASPGCASSQCRDTPPPPDVDNMLNYNDIGVEATLTSVKPQPTGAHSSVGSLLHPVMVVYFVTFFLTTVHSCLGQSSHFSCVV